MKWKLCHHKMRVEAPDEIIKFIDDQYPLLKGICYYDAEQKELASTNKEIAQFHYDPFHTVLQIQIKDND